MMERRVGYRWTVCALLFAVTTINYVDRQVFSILAPTLQRDLGWTETDYGDIVSWFSLVYAFGFLAAGRLLDRIGVKRGLAFAVVTWSLAAMATAFARTTAGFSAVRAALGLGEAANFPGAVKAVAEWFPRRERALATGIFNAGTNTGAIVAPLLVPWITLRWGWQWAFIATGALGFIWLIVWLVFYRSPDDASGADAAELEHIRSDPSDMIDARAARVRSDRNIAGAAPVPWLQLFRYRQTWAVITGKLCADPIWWFYLYWLPKFLDSRYGITLANLALPLIVVYLVADVGSITGGWLPGALMKRGWSPNRARKTAMLTMALIIVPTAFAPLATSMWTAIIIVGIAAAAHQGWSANVYTLASDLFPKHAVASIAGVGGFAGAMGGVVFQRSIGRILQANGNDYAPVFAVCGLAYVTGWVIIHLLAPRLQPVQFDRVPSMERT